MNNKNETVTVIMTQEQYEDYLVYLDNYNDICNALTDLTDLYRKQVRKNMELTIENNELKLHLQRLEKGGRNNGK